MQSVDHLGHNFFFFFAFEILKNKIYALVCTYSGGKKNVNFLLKTPLHKKGQNFQEKHNQISYTSQVTAVKFFIFIFYCFKH